MRDAWLTGWTIAVKDTRETWRDGRFRAALLVLLVVLCAAAVSGWQRAASAARLRQEAEAAERRLSLDKGAMNPHAAAHYGAFVFKPVEPLTAIDPGLDPYVGVSVFLEAHQQQLPRTDSDALAASGRVGELSAAGGLQVLVPLLIIALTFSALAGERDAGTLRQLASVGISRYTLGWAKLAAALIPVAAVLIPAAIVGTLAMLWQMPDAVDADLLNRAWLLAAAYLVYFLLWAMWGVIVSARSRAASTALIVLLAVWFTTTLVIPPLAAAGAQVVAAAPSAARYTQLVQDARATLPQWAERVSSVEERFLSGELPEGPQVPSNPEVVALIEAEHEESQLYDTLLDTVRDSLDAQARFYERLGIVSPSLAVQTLSMALAGTDHAQHRLFLEATSAYRRTFLQSLNAELAAYNDVDTFDYTRGRELWEQIPAFEFRAPDVGWTITEHRTGALSLGLWFVLSAVVFTRAVGTMRVA